MTRLADEPPGWRELCARLQTAKDVAEFQEILDRINRLLTAHEKAHPQTLPDKVRTPKTRNSAKRTKAPSGQQTPGQKQRTETTHRTEP